MASDVLQDRYERIALDLTKLIVDNARISPVNQKPDADTILKIYIDSFNVIYNKQLPSKE